MTKSNNTFMLFKSLNEEERKEFWKMLHMFDICTKCGQDNTDFGCSDTCGDPEAFAGSDRATVVLHMNNVEFDTGLAPLDI